MIINFKKGSGGGGGGSSFDPSKYVEAYKIDVPLDSEWTEEYCTQIFNDLSGNTEYKMICGKTNRYGIYEWVPLVVIYDDEYDRIFLFYNKERFIQRYILSPTDKHFGQMECQLNWSNSQLPFKISGETPFKVWANAFYVEASTENYQVQYKVNNGFEWTNIGSEVQAGNEGLINGIVRGSLIRLLGNNSELEVWW